MKKLLIVLPALDVGGAQRFSMNFASYLNEISYDYEILFLRKGKSLELKNEFTSQHIKFHELSCNSVLLSIPKLILYIKKIKPTTIISTVGNVDFAMSIAKIFINKNIHLIIRKANVIFDKQHGFITKLKLRLENRMAYKIVMLTELMKEDYVKNGFDESKLIVINNMVNIKYVENKKNIRPFETNMVEKDKSKFTIIANSRIVQEKRIDVLIKAFNILLKKNHNIRLLIVGSGNYIDTIKEMINVHNRDKIVFLGFQNNPYYFLGISDLFTLTSDYEGFPNSLIEALACQLPVISTNCKSGPSEIIDDGIDGYLIEKGDYLNLANKIQYLIDNPNIYNNMKKNTLKKAKKYDVASISKKYLEIIK